MADAQLYEETFQVHEVQDETYDRVHRIRANSHDQTTSVMLDLNSELYPMTSGETFSLLVASTLNLDGTKDEGLGWRGRQTDPTLADLWDYVCYGKVYKVEDPEEGSNIKVYVSFGGLLMAIEGPYKKLSPLKIENVYLLLKK